MPKTRKQKPVGIAIAAILAFTLTTATPAFAAGPAGDFSATLTSWVRTWLAPFLGPAAGDSGSEAQASSSPARASSRSSEKGTSVPTAHGTGDEGHCELVCTEAGPGGDPNG